ncbi:MAG: hypothetical protein PHV18_11500 [Lachnospiraceae bacterium]|nr:hypothetical protein [Lachnospiraceae bacterium]
MRKDTESGSTMIEVIVAFTVLVLIMGIFSQAMALTGRMLGKSGDTLAGYRDLAGDYYLSSGTGKDETLHFELVTGGSSSAGFSVDARFREFKNSNGTIYDVIPAESAEESE